MAKVNITQELLEKHSDAELYEFLANTMQGIVRNYKTSLETKDSNVLWGNLGDLTMVMGVLVALSKREKERLARIDNA